MFDTHKAESKNSPVVQAEPTAAARDTAATMQVLESQVYRGPNLYGYYPMIRFQLDLGPLEAYPTSRLGGFTDRLIALLPSLYTHGCSYEEPGGFIRRMREGTWLGHVTEHLALELQTLAGTPVTYGKTRSVQGRPGVYNVLYTFREERVGMLAGWLALRLVDWLLPAEFQGVAGLSQLVPRRTQPLNAPDAPFDLDGELEALIRLAQRLALGPTTQALVDEAKRRGIPAIRLDDESFVQLGYKKYQQRIQASVTSKTSSLAAETASDKELTTYLLGQAGLPVPTHGPGAESDPGRHHRPALRRARPHGPAAGRGGAEPSGVGHRDR